MTAYTQTVFTDGSAPGIDASWLNEIGAYVATINPGAVNSTMTPTVIAGTSGGTITMWLVSGPTTGSPVNCFKFYLFYFSGYTNTTGVRQRITLPSPFATGGMAWVGGIHNPSSGYGIYIVNNTSGGVTWDIVTGYNTTSSSLQLPCFSRGEFGGEVSYVDIDGSTTGGASGWILMIGV